jgi:hypothetical protein
MYGFNLAIQNHMQHQQHNQVDFRVISELLALKTSNSIDFSKTVSIRLKKKTTKRSFATLARISSKRLLFKDKYFIFTMHILRLIKINFKGYIQKKTKSYS